MPCGHAACEGDHERCQAEDRRCRPSPDGPDRGRPPRARPPRPRARSTRASPAAPRRGRRGCVVHPSHEASRSSVPRPKYSRWTSSNVLPDLRSRPRDIRHERSKKRHAQPTPLGTRDLASASSPARADAIGGPAVRRRPRTPARAHRPRQHRDDARSPPASGRRSAMEASAPKEAARKNASL